ncbi:MAG: hypothetical protein A3G08_04665 [Candidatus Magasanikbacteria bacterium RIFCSPLOWO2_12_FULL_47_9b]|nr:MAG: hypothetical protein A3I74_04020 [Candidatus Magasanikbacteria bacterium RIFCSPLOWO2_02_FULL_47_16]OGH79329.1 MAG: hypothetical protein A3C10_04560 [Candidatus Magasanikbacteria bacterium RIFCSPHIGHO2_02_FULL_48_18]OGH81876.1 MAG: hypothetical protein A3G08_04665 [Candidatus Magasanikbacteria bacterium RIFCSPLOWO2_12_FULL_47_9b]
MKNVTRFFPFFHDFFLSNVFPAGDLIWVKKHGITGQTDVIQHHCIQVAVVCQEPKKPLMHRRV